MSSRHRWVPEVHLPLRAGQTGTFLGVYNANGRWVGGDRARQQFTGRTRVRGMRNGTRFRNETIGVTYEFNGLWQPVLVEEPDACRYCDAPQRNHCQRYTPLSGVGTHGWVAPTDQQRLHRMRWRRYLTASRYLSNSLVRRVIVHPDVVPFTLAAPKKTRRSP